jgi:transcriptional regulator NrdR family protein
MQDLQVEKREGGTEPWSKEKVINSVAKAGLSVEVAEHLEFLVEFWARRNAKDRKISSTEVRDKVIDLLGSIDPMVSEAYGSYKK